MLRFAKRNLVAVLMAGLLAACGGGGGSSGGGGGGGGGGGPIGGGGTSSGPPPTEPEAARLLTQATFGPSESSIQSVISSGSVNSWVSSQLSMPLSTPSHLAYLDATEAARGFLTVDNFYQSWWRHAISSPDQLRQRVAFALSQIFVISLNDPAIDLRGAAAYYDMLTSDAFGNFRTLLEDVTMHPMMGRYLTYLANQKEDPAGSRTPDENYAREVMQLMTIGLVELNADGSQKLNNGQPIPTYSPADIAGLAKVFTGLSWYNPAPTNDTFFGDTGVHDSPTRPMIFYPTFHSTSEKTFLGVTIPASATVDIGGDIDIALDRLFNHANTGPFISRRLIQQLVTSNPSPEYIGRVAAVFANNGSGVRGDMAAVVRAILTDAEARDLTAAVSSPSFGKLREPVIRIANWARAFGAISVTGNYLIRSTSSNTELNQSPLSSPSVFNFWRPGFTPPGTTQVGQRSLVAPEFQIVDEVTAASYINFFEDVLDFGIGLPPDGIDGRDVNSSYTPERAIAANTTALVDRMNKLLLYGQMTQPLRDNITAAVSILNTGDVDRRVRMAIFMTMISPEYLIQR